MGIRTTYNLEGKALTTGVNWLSHYRKEKDTHLDKKIVQQENCCTRKMFCCLSHYRQEK